MVETQQGTQMNANKATFLVHLFWLDFSYRARLDASHPMDAERARLWMHWVGSINIKRAEQASGMDSTALQVLVRIVNDLELHDTEHYRIFIDRVVSRDSWYRRWARLLVLALRSDLVDDVGADIALRGVSKNSQMSVQAFLWSTKGLDLC